MSRVLMCGPDAASGGVATHTKSLIAEMEKLDVIILFYDISGSNFKKIYQRTVGLLLNAIRRKSEYDAIHVQTSGGIFSFTSAITGAIASRVLKKRLVVTFHHSQTSRFVTNYKYAFRFVLNRSDRLILVSQKQKEAVISSFEDTSGKITVLPNGFKSSLYYAMDKATCRAKLGLPYDKKIIFNISNLIESKGHKYLISAMQYVVATSNHCECYIAGKGYFKESLENQINELQLQNHVKLLGWIPDEQIPMWMNACDLFVHPSLAESFGIVQIEAMACGKPVVATINGGSESIITSDKYGLLCEPANPQDLSEKIIEGLSKRWDNNVIYSYASSNYRWDFVAQKTKNVYEEILRSGYS